MSRNLSTAEVARILGLREQRIRELVRSGLLSPARRGRGYTFSFQDLVVLRAARGLLDARVPVARVRRALVSLIGELPVGHSLSGLRIYADGRQVAVCDGDAAWQPESGQTLLNFDTDTLARQVESLRSRAPRRDARSAAARGRLEFERALDLEDEDPKVAAVAYRRALALDPELSDAYVNLGRILHESGEPREAALLYHQALQRSPDDPVIHFNLALALEDARGPEPAAAHYEQALGLDPHFADAHFNLAGVYEQLGRRSDALRHLSAYRRLSES